jgi:hypothetical protein
MSIFSPLLHEPEGRVRLSSPCLLPLSARAVPYPAQRSASRIYILTGEHAPLPNCAVPHRHVTCWHVLLVTTELTKRLST